MIASADDPNTVPAALLNTHCSTDQLFAAVKVVDPAAYAGIVAKYNTEPQWVQQSIHDRMDQLLAKNPDERQTEVDGFAVIFPYYASLFRMHESSAQAVAAKCPQYEVDSPTLWDPPGTNSIPDVGNS